MPDNNPVNDQRISLFLRKLWTLVNSPDTNDVITWNEDGDSFVIKNQVDFCKLLPKYFKHNNFMSFVRQLHIYRRSSRQPVPSLESEREKVALDISSLKKQYSKLKERQKQVQVILTAACNGQNFIGTSNSSAMNHLLFGKTALRCTSIGPIPGSIPLKYIQDVKKPEPKIEPRVRQKRTVSSSSSSSSSTSTELCDDPASDDCCSERSVDDDDDDCPKAPCAVDGCDDCDMIRTTGDDDDDDDAQDDGGGAGGEGIGTAVNGPGAETQDEDDSLTEVLRANSEMLSRMCSRDDGGPSAVTRETEDLDERLPDLINDIDESLTAVVRSGTADPSAEVRGRRCPCREYDTPECAEPPEGISKGSESPEGISKGSEPPEGISKCAEPPEWVFKGPKPPEGNSKGSEPSESVSKGSEPPEAGSKVVDEPRDPAGTVTAAAVRPFAPFPSKVRQPKRLGIELGLYPDGSSN